MSTEKTLQAACLRDAKVKGWLTYKFASPSKRGVPDVIMIRGGRVVFVEFKHPNGTGKLSPLQEIEINKLRGQDMEVYVINNRGTFNENFA